MVKVAALILSCLGVLLGPTVAWREAEAGQAAARQNRRTKRTETVKRKKRRPSTVQRSAAGTPVPPGDWGGEHIKLEIGENGARLEFDCAHSTVSQQITLDDRNSFDVVGEYVSESGGPERVGERPDAHPVRYTGRIDGQKMTISVTLTDRNQEIGTFTLIRGQSPVIYKCL
jgi:hypothetical protein